MLSFAYKGRLPTLGMQHMHCVSKEHVLSYTQLPKLEVRVDLTVFREKLTNKGSYCGPIKAFE